MIIKIINGTVQTGFSDYFAVQRHIIVKDSSHHLAFSNTVYVISICNPDFLSVNESQSLGKLASVCPFKFPFSFSIEIFNRISDGIIFQFHAYFDGYRQKPS